METIPLEPLHARPDLIEACREVWRRGGAVLPVPIRHQAAALAAARRHPEVPEGVALVLLTSGTTGEPKAVMLGHDAIWAAADMTNAALGEGRWLCCLPLHHVAGLGVLLRAAALGIEPVVLEGFDVEAVRRAGFDLVSLVPTMLKRLLDAGVDLEGKTVLLGGGPIPAELVRRAENAGARVIRSYGMTETCGGVVYDGEPLPGVEVEVESDGRIVIASPTLMLGYAPEAGSGLRNGSFRTSDRGRWVEGRLEVLGRLDRVIVTGGENVSAEVVEQRIKGLAGVDDALVLGAPDPEWGEAVVALVVSGRLAEDLLAQLREAGPAHELPKKIIRVPRIPLGPSGKPDLEGARKVAGDKKIVP